jgi:RNA polymerase sigma-70 factor (ECF subfamily)
MLPAVILAIENDFDREFMAQLYLNYNRIMLSTILHVVPNRTDAEDVLQTTIVKLIDKVEKLKTLDRDHLVNYIITACKNTAFNANRDRTHRLTWVYDEVTDQEASGQQDVEEKLIADFDKDALLHIWQKLDPRDEYLLRAKYILEKKDREIAEDIGIKPESVRMALTRARKHALQLMNEYQEG